MRSLLQTSVRMHLSKQTFGRMSVMLLLLLSMAIAADNSTICASNTLGNNIYTRVLANSKIIDDMDRRTEAMESSMATTTIVSQEINRLQNVTASAADLQKLRNRFDVFEQDMNWKWLTIKIEMFALFGAGMFALFIFQKFWEFMQGYFGKFAQRLPSKEKAEYELKFKKMKRDLNLAKARETKRKKPKPKRKLGFLRRFKK